MLVPRGNLSSMLLNRSAFPPSGKPVGCDRDRPGNGFSNVAGSGLIVGKRAQRLGAAAKESLRQRHGLLIGQAFGRGEGEIQPNCV